MDFVFELLPYLLLYDLAHEPRFLVYLLSHLNLLFHLVLNPARFVYTRYVLFYLVVLLLLMEESALVVVVFNRAFFLLFIHI